MARFFESASALSCRRVVEQTSSRTGITVRAQCFLSLCGFGSFTAATRLQLGAAAICGCNVYLRLFRCGSGVFLHKPNIPPCRSRRGVDMEACIIWFFLHKNQRQQWTAKCKSGTSMAHSANFRPQTQQPTTPINNFDIKKTVKKKTISKKPTPNQPNQPHTKKQPPQTKKHNKNYDKANL